MRTQTKHCLAPFLPLSFSFFLSFFFHGKAWDSEKVLSVECRKNTFISIASKRDDNEINSTSTRDNISKCSVFCCATSWNVTRLSGFDFPTTKLSIRYQYLAHRHSIVFTTAFDGDLIIFSVGDVISIARAVIIVISVLNLFLCAFANLSLSISFYTFQFQFQLEASACIRYVLIHIWSVGRICNTNTTKLAVCHTFRG